MIANLSYPVVPRPLKAMAYLFITFGVFSVIDTVAELFLGRMVFSLGVLYIFVGQGLLRLHPRWLTWAMFCTWTGLVFTPIAAVTSLFIPGHLQRLTFFGLNAGQAPHGLCFALSIVAFAFCCWQYGVLKSHQVRQLF